MTPDITTKVVRVASAEDLDRLLEEQKHEGWSLGQSTVVVTEEGGVAFDITFTKPV